MGEEQREGFRARWPDVDEMDVLAVDLGGPRVIALSVASRSRQLDRVSQHSASCFAEADSRSPVRGR